jgi:hypothetical protein
MTAMHDEFQALIDKYRARMRLLRETFDRQGYLLAVSSRDPEYSIILTRNPSSEAQWRVTSFRSGVATGHREYDALDVGSPTQRGFQEFASADFRLVPREHRSNNIRPQPQPT